MAPTTRVPAAASLLHLKHLFRTPYICHHCLRHARPAPTSNPSPLPLLLARPYASFTERVRKKIWGIDNPPGQADPYTRELPSAEEGVPEEEDTRLDIKGRNGVRAANKEGMEMEMEEEDGDGDRYRGTAEYVPAVTWEGLERVGYEGWQKEAWVREHKFKGFIEAKTSNPRKIETALHRALVEVYALEEEGLPLAFDHRIVEHGDDYYAQRVAAEARFAQNEEGAMSLVMHDEDLRQKVLAYVGVGEAVKDERAQKMEEVQLKEQFEEPAEEDWSSAEEGGTMEIQPGEQDISDQEPSERTMDAQPDEHLVSDQEPSEDEELEELSEEDVEKLVISSSESQSVVEDLVSPIDENWRTISLQNSEIKFAVLKRVMQLTGIRIRDPAIANIQTAQALFGELAKRPKPKKLAESLIEKDVAQLPNVQVFERRHTPVDAEKEVGRWKVIEAELKARGLPITGSGSSMPRGNSANA